MSNVLELLEEVFEVKFRDTVHKMRCPTQLELLDFSESYEKIKDNKKKFYAIVNYFDSLGFPKEAGEQLSSANLEKLLKLFESKKN